jgi:hypothetical protein
VHVVDQPGFLIGVAAERAGALEATRLGPKSRGARP